ncbi:MAG: hypothetical protein E6I06_01510 [Chloroflexi bacterium]|nr:MAG: hypothetical protein E6I06_01510 [Chloroflexota bacterium]
MQPPDRATPRWSPDLLWWWDGARWVPASQAPLPPPPAAPPGYYSYVPPPASAGWAPSPGLRTFLLVFLGLDAGLTGLLSLFGTLGEIQNISQGATQDPSFATGIIFWLVFLALFGLAILAIVGVARRSPWARWVALADGIVISLTCLGLVLGIPIIVAAARAPLGRPASPTVS